MFRKDIVIPSGAVALALCVFSIQADPLKPTQYGDFDRYVLALSWQTGFCQSMVERNRDEPEECRLQKESSNKTDFLTVHGLWPALPKSIAARGVDERRWMRFGCATRPVPNMPEAKASRKCDAAETGLSLTGAAKLNSVMPGAGGNSCLERYEYAKHGVCFGFDPDAYFGTMHEPGSEAQRGRKISGGKLWQNRPPQRLRCSRGQKLGKTERKSVQAYLPRQSGLSDRDANLAKIQHH